MKQLDNELLISSRKSLITVADPEKLLKKLAEGHKGSTERKRRNSYRYTIEGLELWNFPESFGVVLLAYGFYAAQIKSLAATDMKTVFVKDIEQLRRKIDNGMVA